MRDLCCFSGRTTFLERASRARDREVSWSKQHRYLTLVADHIRGQIVWGTEGNSAAAADEFFAELGTSRSHAIEVISLDMGPGYAKSAAEHAPQAIIAIDPFHVVALANRALDDVRRGYWNELRQIGDRDAARRFKDARWSLLKAPENPLTARPRRWAPSAAPAATCGAAIGSRKRCGRSSPVTSTRPTRQPCSTVGVLGPSAAGSSRS